MRVYWISGRIIIWPLVVLSFTAGRIQMHESVTIYKGRTRRNKKLNECCLKSGGGLCDTCKMTARGVFTLGGKNSLSSNWGWQLDFELDITPMPLWSFLYLCSSLPGIWFCSSHRLSDWPSCIYAGVNIPISEFSATHIQDRKILFESINLIDPKRCYDKKFKSGILFYLTSFYIGRPE